MDDVLSFWFEEIPSSAWWSVDPEFDKQISQRFGELLMQAAAGELHAWRATFEGRLAEIIILDQFSRNVYRNTPKAFSQDGQALVLCQEAIAQGALEQLAETERGFLIMPMMHSESLAIHKFALPLFEKYTSSNTHEFELKHMRIIEKFGRYPHRNDILNRKSTLEELEFLKTPGSRF